MTRIVCSFDPADLAWDTAERKPETARNVIATVWQRFGYRQRPTSLDVYLHQLQRDVPT